MEPKLSQAERGRLERLCKSARGSRRDSGDRIWLGEGALGIERLQAHLVGQPFGPHRHDTYAVGITLYGVQSFCYRGERHHCLPGQVHVLHPDETHDGGSGDERSFGYRIVYLDPCLIREALDCSHLPFAPSPVVSPSLLPLGAATSLWNIEAEVGDLERAEIAVVVGDLLAGLASRGAGTSRQPTKKASAHRSPALDHVKDFIASQPAQRPGLEALERVAGMDRWLLARQFRAAFGTSPSRFRTMRQLDQVRRLVRGGTCLAEAAADAGFADQSHMSHHFRRAYGLTPANWAAALKRGAATERRTVAAEI